MLVSLVAAVARNGVIGNKGGLAWRISDDLKWFKQVTTGKPVIMGRKTFDSIGKALPGRDNIVITRSSGWAADNVLRASDIDDALGIAETCAIKRACLEACVIGGAEIYRQTIDRADRIYLTRVDAAPAGDVYFPHICRDEWRETLAGSCEKAARNEHSCQFFILDRVRTPE